MIGPAAAPGDSAARLLALARTLSGEGRHSDAVVLFDHLSQIAPDSADVLCELATSLAARGRTLEALDALARAKGLGLDEERLRIAIHALTDPAVASFNAHREAGEIEQAEQYASAMVRLIPNGAPMLTAALSCNQALGRWNEVLRYAETLIVLEPDSVPAHAALAEICKVRGDVEGEVGHRIALALSPNNPLHPLLRLRDTHDAASLTLCRQLTPQAEAQVEVLLSAARNIVVEADFGSEWEGWEKHYRLLLAAVDLDAIRAPTPSPAPEPAIAFLSATGASLAWDGVKAAAEHLGAQCVFFAAADEAYVDLYARWYALSVLKYCDIPCLVIVHVIGGAAALEAISERVDVRDERLIFVGDAFDAASVATLCYDAPPKGLIAKPVAHFQSARFQHLGALVRHLALPVFVSDIDLILQRGVADLLERHAGDDVVLNENEVTFNAGSRLTANLLLVYPTPNTLMFLDFLRSVLDASLAGAEVTRWIDQLALLLARHHLMRHGQAPRLGYFDTKSDINNVMYKTYQEHPFRFLSLYHGFDTSSLEGEAGVLG